MVKTQTPIIDQGLRDLIENDFKTFISPFENLMLGKKYLKTEPETYLRLLPTRAKKTQTQDGWIKYHLNQLEEEEWLDQVLRQGDDQKYVNLEHETDPGVLEMVQSLFIGKTNQERIEDFQILSVYRIDNPYITEMYSNRENPSDNLIWAWHSTAPSNVLSISRNHYRTPGEEKYVASYGKNFGIGLYFAPEALGTLWYNLVLEDCFDEDRQKITTGWLFLNQIDLGNVYNIPPNDVPDAMIPDGYDSVYVHAKELIGTETWQLLGPGGSHDEIVVRRKERVLPKFLVKIACREYDKELSSSENTYW